MKQISIIEAPSILGLKETGVDLLAQTLLSCGLAERLSVNRITKVDSLPYDKHRDPETGFLNFEAIASYSKKLADSVHTILEAGSLPLVLGGDCSILLGNLLALRRRGRFGLFFADGHTDFYQAEANINGEMASSELAIAAGYGPTLIEGIERLVREEDVFVFGFRDESEQRQYGSQILPPTMMSLSLDSIRNRGFREAVEKGLSHLCQKELEGFWLHLDADVLSDEVMPAVDYRLPGGLSWDELVELQRMCQASGRLVGLDVTIYNPRLDPDGHIAAELTDALVNGLK